MRLLFPQKTVNVLVILDDNILLKMQHILTFGSI